MLKIMSQRVSNCKFFRGGGHTLDLPRGACCSPTRRAWYASTIHFSSDTDQILLSSDQTPTTFSNGNPDCFTWTLFLIPCSPWPAFVLEVPLCNFLTSVCDFVPCDWIYSKGSEKKSEFRRGEGLTILEFRGHRGIEHFKISKGKGD